MGTKLDMKAQTFFLGGNTIYKWSGGTIAITSSNFHLDTDGNVGMYYNHCSGGRLVDLQ